MKRVKTKPKILLLLHYPPPVHGAAMVGQYIRESKTINNSLNGRYLNLGTSRTIEEIGKGGLKKWLRYFCLIWKAGFNVISFRPDLVYLTLTSKGAGFYKDSLVAIIAKLLGSKMVYHFHNKGVSTRQDRWFDNILYKFVFKNADVILLSEHLYPDIKKFVSKNRVHICPNGIPEIAQSEKFRVQSVANKPVEILFLSNLIESKGVFVLLEACKILKDKEINFHCNYVGGEGNITGGQLHDRIIGLKLADKVHYLGKKYGSEKAEAFSIADIFVHPTSDDCFPLVLLEAMQFSLPIISTNEGGIPGIVENDINGFLVEKNNIEALANKLEELIASEDLSRNFGENGKRRYENEFTLPAFENRFKEILFKIAKPH